MTQKIDTVLLAKILEMLSSEHDGAVLSAARQATRIVREGGKRWADLLPKMPAAHEAQRVVDPQGNFWLPPIGATWHETARWLVRWPAPTDRREGQIVEAIATKRANGFVIDPQTITPEIAETLTMIYRRVAGLPT